MHLENDLENAILRIGRTIKAYWFDQFSCWEVLKFSFMDLATCFLKLMTAKNDVIGLNYCAQITKHKMCIILNQIMNDASEIRLTKLLKPI